MTIIISSNNEQTMQTISIKYCDIPVFLREGEFFRALSDDDPQDLIEIPAECFAKDGGVPENVQQFSQLLRVMLFWVLDAMPLGVVRFCFLNDIEIWRDAVLNVPGGDKSSLVKGLFAAFPEKTTLKLFVALEIGNWDVIAACIHIMDQSHNHGTLQAAEHGNLRALKLLYEKGFVWHEDTCAMASQNGHLDCLRFAHENGCPWDVEVYTVAAIKGHLHCIQYAHQQGLEWTTEVCKCAAYYGHCACLHYIMEHGCPVDNSVCCSAAHEGHVHCLQLLHQHNAPWDTHTCMYAAMRSDIACLQYLHNNGCPHHLHCSAAW